MGAPTRVLAAALLLICHIAEAAGEGCGGWREAITGGEGG
jgi:hypothetical protein